MNRTGFLCIVLAGLLGIATGILVGRLDDIHKRMDDQEILDDIRKRLDAQEQRLTQKLTPKIEIKNASVWTSKGELIIMRDEP